MRAAVIQSMLLSAGHLSAPSSLQAMNQDPASLAVPAITPEEFDELDLILDDLRSRHDETPQWEFCEGFMAALICCRRLIPPSEYLPVLLDIGPPGQHCEGSFENAAQAESFFGFWMRRWNEVAQALDAEVDSLDDARAYYPEVMDVRGAVGALPSSERDDIQTEGLPSFGQVWALGFMFAVENWPQDWSPPRDKEAIKWLEQGLQAMVALTEDDNDPPTIAMLDDDGPPSVSEKRFEAFADAIWAVYDLREMWRNIGPRVETVYREATPGRNDPCYCGSGKKYKKCHGAN